MILTAENYYSQEANLAYMSASQFKAFDRCEAAALAELGGEYIPPASTALLVGGYVDAWFSGELPLFQGQHPEIFKRDGTLKSEYIKAQSIIAKMEDDGLFSLLMGGRKQYIVVGEIAGIPFKGKLDSLLSARECMDINSLVTYTTDITEPYHKNRVIRLLNTVANDIYQQFSDGYIGVVNNNEQGRMMFKSAIVGYLLDIQANNGIQNFEAEDVTVEPGEAIDAIVVNLAIQPVDSVEKIYVTITVN